MFDWPSPATEILPATEAAVAPWPRAAAVRWAIACRLTRLTFVASSRAGAVDGGGVEVEPPAGAEAGGRRRPRPGPPGQAEPAPQAGLERALVEGEVLGGERRRRRPAADPVRGHRQPQVGAEGVDRRDPAVVQAM